MKEKYPERPLGIPPVYTLEQKTEALKHGEETYRRRGTLEDCPVQFRPKLDDDVLSHMWMMGFEGARIAGIKQKKEV